MSCGSTSLSLSTAFVVQCLAKEPSDRWQSARDIARYLPIILALPAEPATARWKYALAMAAMLALGAVAGGVVVWESSRGTAATTIPRSTRLSVTLPADTMLAPSDGPQGGSSIASSPDGRSIAFAATRGGVTVLGTRSPDTGLVKILGGTEGARLMVESQTAQLRGNSRSC